MLKIYLIIFTNFIFLIFFSQEIVINEFMSSNNNYYLDEDGDDSDYIEIYNNSENSINLFDFYLSDDNDELQKWKFPNINLNPKQFLIVFASGKDKKNNELHTNFKIESEGEKLYISNNNDVILETPKVNLEQNVSYGLFPDGSSNFVLFKNPSPEKSNNNSIYLDKITFSKNGGMYSTNSTINISNDSLTYQIYYTIDGSIPTKNSILYDGNNLLLNEELFSTNNISSKIVSPQDIHHDPPSNLPKCIVIRAASFNSNGIQKSEVITNSYFIKNISYNHNNLSIISLTASNNDLFDFETGIYIPGINYNEDNPKWTGNYYKKGYEWEIPAHFEYYDVNGVDFSQDCGLRIHGGNSRRPQQKGLRLYARSEYGNEIIDFPFFGSDEVVKFKRLVLKPFSSNISGLNNYFTSSVAENLNVESLNQKPVVLYLNGEYWGIYFLQERLDEYYLESNFGIDAKNVDIIRNWEGLLLEGDNDDFLELYSYISINDLSIQEKYAVVENWIDIDNFIDYQLFEIFIGNYDWPQNNIICWREKKVGVKWRWIFVDGDVTLKYMFKNNFKHALDTLGEDWPTNPTATLFLRKLLKNQEFKMKFLNRLEVLLNDELCFKILTEKFKNCVNEIEKEIPLQNIRFGRPKSLQSWLTSIDVISKFLQVRSYSTIVPNVYEMFDYSLNITKK